MRWVVLSAILSAGSTAMFVKQDQVRKGADPSCTSCCEQDSCGVKAKCGSKKDCGTCDSLSVFENSGKCGNRGQCGDVKSSCGARQSDCAGKKSCGEVKSSCEAKSGCANKGSCGKAKSGCGNKSEAKSGCGEKGSCGEAKSGCGSKESCGEAKTGCGDKSEAKSGCGSKDEAKSGCGDEAKSGCGSETTDVRWESGDGQGKIDWLSSYDSAIQKGRDANKPVILHFYANWCAPCRTMNRTTFSDSKVAAFQNSNFVSVQFNIDECVELAGRYKIDVIPAILVVTPTGDVLSKSIEQEPTAYLTRLNAVTDAFAQWTQIQAQIAQTPGDANLHLQLGGLFESLGGTIAAANAFDKAADLLMAPKNLSEQARREIGIMLVRIGDSRVNGQADADAARIDLVAEKLETLDADGALGYRDNALYLRAMAMGARHQADKMIETLASITRQHPESDKIDAIQIWTAWAYLTLKENPKQCSETLKEFMVKYPQSTYSDYAKQLLRRAERGEKLH